MKTLNQLSQEKYGKNYNQLPDDGAQQVWSWRNRRWEPRNESITAGRAYRGMSGFRRATKIAAKIGGKTSIDNQW